MNLWDVKLDMKHWSMTHTLFSFLENLTDDTDDTMGSGASNDGGSSPPKVASQSRNQMSVKAGSSQALHTKQPSLRRQGSSAISRQLTRSFSNAASLRSADHASRASIGYSTSQNKFIGKSIYQGMA